VLKTDY